MTSIGVKPNQIPVNGMLGEMAFQDPAAVNITGGLIADKPVGTLVDETALALKVDKVDGQSLMLDAERTKLSGIAAGAQVNAVTSVAGRTGAVTLAKADVGLSSVDNTPDTAKPVSTAQQAALDGKVDKVSGKGLSTNDLTAALLNKLNGIAAGATANDTDAQLRARATHTGTQAMNTVTGLAEALAAKQDISSVVAISASRTLALSDAGNYLRPTATVTLTVPTNASVAFPINTEITVRSRTGNTTLSPASGVTLRAPAGGTLVLNAGMTVTLKKVGTNEWDVIGQTVAA